MVDVIGENAALGYESALAMTAGSAAVLVLFYVIAKQYHGKKRSKQSKLAEPLCSSMLDKGRARRSIFWVDHSSMTDMSFGRTISAKHGFFAFLSHYKVEAGSEARILQIMMQHQTKQRVFLDSDDLQDLATLQDMVSDSKVFVLLLSRGVLLRPWCLMEIMTAIQQKIPIVTVLLTGPSFDGQEKSFDHSKNKALLENLDIVLPKEHPSVCDELLKHNIDLTMMTYFLSNTLPNIISISLNPSGSESILDAAISSICDGVKRQPPKLLPYETWLKKRREKSSAQGKLKNPLLYQTC